MAIEQRITAVDGPFGGGAGLPRGEEGVEAEGVDGALDVAGTARKTRLGGEGAEKGAGLEVGGGEALAGESGEGLVLGVDFVDDPGRDWIAERR